MEFGNHRKWTTQEKIELLQRWILVHSYLYYIMDMSIVSDHRYDMNSLQLYSLKVENSESWDRSRYTYAMNDFNGSTGFGFVEHLLEKERKSIMWDISILCNNNVLRRKTSNA